MTCKRAKDNSKIDQVLRLSSERQQTLRSHEVQQRHMPLARKLRRSPWIELLQLEPDPKALLQALLKEEYLIGWKIPWLPTYYGKSSPDDHLHAFMADMEDMMFRHNIWRWMFCRTLIDDAGA